MQKLNHNLKVSLTLLLTCFLIHHELFSTIEFNTINFESDWMPLTENTFLVCEEGKFLSTLSTMAAVMNTGSQHSIN